MAIKPTKIEEHAFKRIQRDMQEGSLGNPLFFYGEEQYLVRWAVESIVELFSEPGLRQLNCAKLSGEAAFPETIMAQCETLPMLSEKRIVIVDGFPAGAEDAKDNYSEGEEKELISYFNELPDTCLLILTSVSADKRRKLYKTLVGLGSCYEFNRLDEEELRKFIRNRLRKGGKTAGSAVIRQIIETSGYFDKQTDYTLYNLDNDIKKLIAVSDGDEISMADVARGLSGNTEVYVFNMIDALSRNRKDEALLLLHRLLTSGESVYKLLALICSHYETILMVKEMKEEGLSPAEMKSVTGVHEYRIKMAAQFSGRYDTAQLRQILCSSFAVDKNIKTGLLEERLALEMLIASI